MSMHNRLVCLFTIFEMLNSILKKWERSQGYFSGINPVMRKNDVIFSDYPRNDGA
jgi:hypothetical protein